MAIVIEGVDGTGKSTMCDTLAQAMHMNIYRHFSTAFGKEIYRLMDEYSLNCQRDRYLFYALATHEYGEIVGGKYGSQSHVLLDRYTPISNLVYGKAFNVQDTTLRAGKDIHILDIDAVLIYTADFDVAQDRMDRRKYKSAYDKSSQVVFERINNLYKTINEWIPNYIEDFPTCMIVDTTNLTIQEQYEKSISLINNRP